MKANCAVVEVKTWYYQCCYCRPEHWVCPESWEENSSKCVSSQNGSYTVCHVCLPFL